MWMTLDSILWILALAVLVPTAVFAGECLLSILPGRSRSMEKGKRPRATILIPAHDEEHGIAETLQTLLPTLNVTDRVLVVADNCSDGTARVARAYGAEVVERHCDDRRGKGFALEHGIRALADSADAPEVVVFLDADCRVAPNTVDQLARAVARTGRPVQGLNLSEAESGGVQAISSLGFHFKNLVRPAGLARVGMPCHLMGTGMALPWALASNAVFAGANLVEDMQLGVDLAISGKPPLFCQSALVTSRLPTGRQAFLSQRTRWEHGHLRTSLTQIPRLIGGFVRTADFRLLALAGDLVVPPFSLLVFSWCAAMALALGAAFCGADKAPAAVLAAAGAGIVVAVLLGWARHCRHAVPFGSLAAAPLYVIRKLPIYASFFLRRGPQRWIRTERDVPASPG